MVVGRGQNFGGGGGGGGSPYTYTTFFIDDGGPARSGDLMSVNAYRNEPPFGCLAPQEYESEPFISGDVNVNGSGVSFYPAATVVATGAVQNFSSGGTDSFDVTAISDGAGNFTGNISMSRSFGSSSNGSITCLSVVGNEIVVGGRARNSLVADLPPMVLWFTLYLTDNGPNGTQDMAAFDGPTNMQPPDCSSTAQFPQNLSYGQVTDRRRPVRDRDRQRQRHEQHGLRLHADVRVRRRAEYRR